MRIYRHGTWSLALLALVLLATGCGRMQAARPAENPEFAFTLAVHPDPPAVGPAEWAITLADRAGNAVEGARLQVEGDMTHAGMQPVFGESSGGQGGRYTVPMKWTMSGDWIVTVKATLADGRTASKDFPVRVGE
jgi:hypothetical protein